MKRPRPWGDMDPLSSYTEEEASDQDQSSSPKSSWSLVSLVEEARPSGSLGGWWTVFVTTWMFGWDMLGLSSGVLVVMFQRSGCFTALTVLFFQIYNLYLVPRWLQIGMFSRYSNAIWRSIDQATLTVVWTNWLWYGEEKQTGTEMVKYIFKTCILLGLWRKCLKVPKFPSDHNDSYWETCCSCWLVVTDLNYCTHWNIFILTLKSCSYLETSAIILLYRTYRCTTPPWLKRPTPYR